MAGKTLAQRLKEKNLVSKKRESVQRMAV
ncbi:hypothetical protein CL3_05460 [butyrate-producing bacterium SM4/1]|nr:hypothetical protein CLS_17160 [[Clostridium] cf. saccharolyticum K10]CBL35687.1 hypothetical protein CL3_05460 [butyrate-producing bacterium SM4/1]